MCHHMWYSLSLCFRICKPKSLFCLSLFLKQIRFSHHHLSTLLLYLSHIVRPRKSIIFLLTILKLHYLLLMKPTQHLYIIFKIFPVIFCLITQVFLLYYLKIALFLLLCYLQTNPYLLTQIVHRIICLVQCIL